MFRPAWAGGREEECPPKAAMALEDAKMGPLPLPTPHLRVPTARMADGVWLGETSLSSQGSQEIWLLKELSNPPLSYKRLAWRKPQG